VAAALAERVYVMAKGSIVSECDAAAFLADKELQREHLGV
jgi:ABC-type branched-subunit amino acid transport system ATPase component